ncbi:MAG: PQQ-dependent sugar dehydrogenase [Verrucomicrobiales bacterium]|nr:PQQ-dependent sugar dehydrogenase [Verrucomicrobiales bacterium]
MFSRLTCFALALAVATLPLAAQSTPDAAPVVPPDQVSLTRLYSGLETAFPITLQLPPDGSNRRFLALQRGQILILPSDEAATAPLATFLDLSPRGMEADNGKFEEGLNGFAFHPDYASNRKFYLCYTMQKPKRLVISEMQTSASDANAADETTERVLLEIPLVNWNHHGGNILFGPDGFLYIGVGDMSKRDDGLRLAQNTAVLNGKILRIDVDGRDHGAYGIPADNPHADGDNARPQIWALGIRNPWGLHFDATGRLWCADVGQNLMEEINWIQRGGNYGWSYHEGRGTFVLRNEPDPEGAAFIEPILEYDHATGLSITGGITYHGKALSNLEGAYVYGDFVVGKIWALQANEDGSVASNTLLYTSPIGEPEGGKKKPKVMVKPTAFCADENGEIMVLDWNGGIYRITPAP